MSLAHDIATQLADRKGKKPTKNGDGWVTCCPVHGDDTPSLSIIDKGTDDVAVKCFSGCDWKAIKAELVNLGMLPEWKPDKKPKKSKPATDEQPSIPDDDSIPAETVGLKTDPELPAEHPAEKRSFVWDKSRSGSPLVPAYFATRGINFTDDDGDFPFPACFRYNTYTDKKSGSKPEMVVAAASKPSDETVYAIQRLFIDTTDPALPYKVHAKMLGDLSGRGVWFYRDMPMETLVVGEGIETTLSVMQATGLNGVATLSTSGMKNIIFPATTKTIYILTDSDVMKTGAKKGYAGQKAALSLAERAESEGIKAFIVVPDSSCFTQEPIKKDFNDLLQDDPSGETINLAIGSASLLSEISWTAPEPAVTPEKGDNGAGTERIMGMMLDRFIYMRNGNLLIDNTMPPQHALMTKQEFMTEFKELGKVRFNDGPSMWATEAFFANNTRKKVVGERYHPGKPRIYSAEDVKWFNPFHMPEWPDVMKIGDYRDAGAVKSSHSDIPVPVATIISHLHYLLPGDDQYDRFMGWFAYTLHYPALRCKSVPLMISHHHGTGRGFVAELIRRLLGSWNCTECTMDELAGIGNKGQYHNYLYRSLFTSMPEVKVKRKDAFAVDDAIRGKLIDEYYNLNLKYGDNGTHPVFTNFMMASNHFDALQIGNEDRRIDVYEHHERAKNTDYYAKLYAVLSDKEALAYYFHYTKRFLNTDAFDPMAIACVSPAKLRMIGGSKTDIEAIIDNIADEDGVLGEVATYRDIIDAIVHELSESGMGLDPALEKVEEDKGIIQAIVKAKFPAVNMGRKMKIDGVVLKVYAIRNQSVWVNANRAALRVVIKNSVVAGDNESPF